MIPLQMFEEDDAEFAKRWEEHPSAKGPNSDWLDYDWNSHKPLPLELQIQRSIAVSLELIHAELVAMRKDRRK